MLKQLYASSKRILVAPRVDAPFSQSRTAASSAESRASAEESYEEGANNTAKTQKPKNGKPLPARRLAYKSPPRDLLFGIHPVEIALAEKRRKFYKLFLRPNRVVPFSEDLQNIAEWAANLKVPIVYKRNGELSSLTNESLHQGVVLQASRLNHKDWSEQIEIFGESDDDGKLLVYMDRVMDPMNMGAVIRSCVFLGVDTILVPSKYSCRLSPTVSKASSGALECAPICTVEDPQQLMVFVQKLGWEVLGTDSDCLPYDQYEATSKNRLLILGNEGHGVNEELVNFFSKTISVPGVTNRVGSLNVSVTAGILLSHFSKHKRLL